MNRKTEHDLPRSGHEAVWSRRFFEISADLLGLADLQGRFIELNRSWERVLGYTCEELLAAPYIEFVHPDDRAQTQAMAERLKAPSSVGIHFTNRYRHKDGSYRWISWSLVPLVDEQRIAFIARDVTPEKEMAERLAASEERLRSIMNSAPVSIMAFDREGTIQSMSRPVFPEVPEGAIVGHNIFSLLTQGERADFRERFSHVLASGEVTQYDVFYRSLISDRQAWLRNQMGPLLRGGEIVGVTCIISDVTEQRTLQEQLRESEERLRSLMNSTPAVILSLDQEATITNINGTLPKPREFYIGKHLFAIIPPDRVAEVRARFHHVLTTGEMAQYDTLFPPGAAGSPTWYRTQMGPLRKSGAIVGAIAVVFDISELKALEAEVRASRDRLEAYAEELKEKNHRLEGEIMERAETEKKLLLQHEMMRAMATPIISVWKGVLALPVIGLVDAARATQMMEMLLRRILEVRARFAIIDLTGVERVDAETAAHLSSIARAASLLGSRCVLSGISPAIAQTMVTIEVGAGGEGRGAFQAFGRLEDALRYTLAELDPRDTRRLSSA